MWYCWQNVRGFSNSEKYIFVYICIYLFIFDLMTSTPLKPEFEVEPVLLWPALPGRGSRGDVCGEHSGLVPGVPGLKQFKHNEHVLLIVPENTGIIVFFVFHFVVCDHFYLSWNLNPRLNFMNNRKNKDILFHSFLNTTVSFYPSFITSEPWSCIHCIP